MSYRQPNLNYQIWVNDVAKELGSNTLVSFNPGFNKVKLKYKSDQSLSLYQIRVTEEHEDWGLELGRLAFQNQGGIQANVWHEANITLGPDVFHYEDSEGVIHYSGVYRLSLCARGDIDGTWDVKYILFTLGGLVFKPTDADAVDLVVTDSVVPDNFNDPQQVGSNLKIDQAYGANQDGTNINII